MYDQNFREANGNAVPDNSISLRDLLAIVFRRRRLIVFSFMGVLIGAIVAMCLMPSSYEAQMKILVERERINPVVSAQASIIQTDRDLSLDEVTSEVELFQSRDSLEKTVVDCALFEPRNPGALSRIKARLKGALGLAPAREKRIFQAVLALEKSLHVIPVNGSNLIKVTYESSSPQTAAQVLRELGDLYLSKHSSVHRLPGTSEFFQQQAEEYRKQLMDAQTRLVSFAHETGVVSADFEKQVSLQKVSEFDVSLQQTRAAIAETKERLQALQAQEASVPARVVTQIRKSDNPQLTANLKPILLNLELRRTELLTKYDPAYPLVKEVEMQIAQTVTAIADADKAGIREETTDQDPTHAWVKTEMAKAKADLVGLEARASVMSGALRRMQNRLLNLDKDSMVQQDLLRAAKANEENYLLYHRKREEARIADALDRRKIVNAAIAEAAAVPLVPNGLPGSVKLVLSLVVASLVSLGAGFLSEHLDPSFRTPGEIKEFLEMPLLAAIPKNGH
jgi:uncharacterized protein involved in exopolysaccharide biosynthesis